MSKNAGPMYALDPKALAAAFKRGYHFLLTRADGYTYASDGVILLRVPAAEEAAILGPTLAAYPYLLTQNGRYKGKDYTPDAPDMALVWGIHVPADVMDLPRMEDTRLTLSDGPTDCRVYHHPDGSYRYLQTAYTGAVTTRAKLLAAGRAEDRPNPAAIVCDYDRPLAIILPYLPHDVPPYLVRPTAADLDRNHAA